MGIYDMMDLVPFNGLLFYATFLGFCAWCCQGRFKK